jgi:RNA polymerase sigma-54 factor
MALTPRLEHRQSQTLVMTPQLQQAIKLLQMSNLELSEYVETELEQNPLLERDEGDQRDDPETATEKPDAPEASLDDQVAPEMDNLEPIDFDSRPGDVEIETETTLDVDYDNHYNNTSDPEVGEAPVASMELAGTVGGASGGGNAYDGDLPGLEDTLSDQPTLRNHLLDQLNMDMFDPVDRLIGQNLIGMLDEAGYLVIDIDALAATLGCPVTRIRDTLERVQQFDPPGVFARDLSECLALQLRDQNRFDPAMEQLVDNLDLVAKREFSALSRVCEVDMEDIVDMVDEIRNLNPKPASNFVHEIIQAVTPDVMMRAQPNGGWYLELNSENLPRVLVNNHYYAKISEEVDEKAERDYIAEQFQSANWLVKALHQRATTILKVATEIVRQQDGFFRKGVQFLRPIVLRDIADVIDMHESTVSRVTSNKYISTPRGIFELKYFFTSAIASSSGGEAHSAESVRHQIKELIDAENPKKILSDDKIVTILNGTGMDVARRTVAKYRESLGIGSSVQRRREKSAPK